MFAEKTKVPAEKSAGEIKRALSEFGGKNFALGTNSDKAYIAFSYKEKRVKVRFSIPANPGASATIAQNKKYEQATNTRWRQLLLCVKAKLESVVTGIETFEQAFMAHIEKAGKKEVTPKKTKTKTNPKKPKNSLKQKSKLSKAA